MPVLILYFELVFRCRLFFDGLWAFGFRLSAMGCEQIADYWIVEFLV
jgi:hypothetical protein